MRRKFGRRPQQSRPPVFHVGREALVQSVRPGWWLIKTVHSRVDVPTLKKAPSVISRLLQYEVLKFAWRKDRQSSQSRTSEEVPARRGVAKRGEFCR